VRDADQAAQAPGSDGAVPAALRYPRVLLKLSGESLAGDTINTRSNARIAA
jgi:hypothetical protein